MIAALIISQTLFYFVVSAAIIVCGILCAMVTWHFVHIARELEEITKNFHNASDEAYERINDIIDRLSALPILSYFLTPKKRADSKSKGRGRTSPRE